MAQSHIKGLGYYGHPAGASRMLEKIVAGFTLRGEGRPRPTRLTNEDEAIALEALGDLFAAGTTADSPRTGFYFSFDPAAPRLTVTIRHPEGTAERRVIDVSRLAAVRRRRLH